MPARETERLDRSEQINSRMMLSLREASYGGAAMGHIYPSARAMSTPRSVTPRSPLGRRGAWLAA
jgi:hypothetical protein